MTSILGIIPAGGKAERFGGLHKELLPTGPDECGLTRCIRSMFIGCASQVIIATTKDRYGKYATELQRDFGVDFSICEYAGIWEVIALVAQYTKADRYLFAMPDTVYPLDIFDRMPAKEPVCVGTFQSTAPERFGAIVNGKILDKFFWDPAPGPTPCWGVWSWSGDVMPVLVDALKQKRDHTSAFELIMDIFGYYEVEMEYYYDFASFEYYREFLCNTPITKITE